MKTLKVLLTICVFAIVCACGGDDDGINGCDINEVNAALEDEIAALDAAGLVYANDPTTANCNAWKSAANDYLDEIEGFQSCDGLSQSEFNQIVQGAQAALDAIPCN